MVCINKRKSGTSLHREDRGSLPLCAKEKERVVSNATLVASVYIKNLYVKRL